MVQDIKRMMRTRIKEIPGEIQELISYSHLKTNQEDFHAVSDAANDIRELQAEKRVLKEFLEMIEEAEEKIKREEEYERTKAKES